MWHDRAITSAVGTVDRIGFRLDWEAFAHLERLAIDHQHGSDCQPCSGGLGQLQAAALLLWPAHFSRLGTALALLVVFSPSADDDRLM